MTLGRVAGQAPDRKIPAGGRSPYLSGPLTNLFRDRFLMGSLRIIANLPDRYHSNVDVDQNEILSLLNSLHTLDGLMKREKLHFCFFEHLQALPAP
jgi:hypothetical protein